MKVRILRGRTLRAHISLLRYGFAALAILAGAMTASAQKAALSDRVLVVYNSEASDSRNVARYYMEKRGIPQANLCKISVSNDDAIDADEFASSVKKPVRKCLETVGKGKILYVVFSYHTPYDVTIKGQTLALDAFVSDIWDEYLPFRPANQSEIQPYFGKAQSEGDLYEPFESLATYRGKPGAKTLYSVWRLDAANPNLAKGLVDKALYAETNGLSGNACFDRRYGAIKGVQDFSYGAGDWDIFRAAEFARRSGFPVIEDEHEQEFGTAPAPLRCDGAALYAGWYSLNHYNNAFSWKPGAIGIHLDSASAANPRGGPNWAANAVMHGITVTSGAVSEPYLDNLPHPDQAFRYLFQGANVGDAMFRSTRMLKWMIINIGDPLYQPFPQPRLARGPIPDLVLALMPAEGLGGGSTTAVIAFDGALTNTDMNFAVKTDRPDIVTVPATVTLPAKTPYVKFPVDTKAVENDATLARIFVSTKGLDESNTLALFPLLAPLMLEPGRVKAGSAATGTLVLRQAAPAGGIKIALATDHPALAKVPDELTIPAGQAGATFPIQTSANGAGGNAVVTARFGGVTRSATLAVER